MNLLRKTLSFEAGMSYESMNEPKQERSYIEALIEDNAEAIFVVDKNYKVIFWNRRCEELLDICRDVVLNKIIGQVVPEFSTDHFKQYASHAISSKAAIAKKFISLKTKSKTLSVTPSFSPLRLPHSDTGCMVILRETGTSETSSRFKSLIEESPIATAIYRPNGSPKYLNKAFGKLWEPAKEVAEKIIKDYNIFEDEQLREMGIMPFIERGFSGETVEIPPIAYHPKDKSSTQELSLGERKYVKGYIFSVKDDFGVVEEVVTVLSDVTFQKQAEEILTDTHVKFQMLTIGLPGVIYELEQDNNGQNKFSYISQGCNEMFGFSPEEIMEDATLLDSVIHPGDLEAFKLSEFNSKKNNTEWQWEGRIIVKGKEKWIEGKSSPTGRKKLRYGLLLDITEKKEVEKQYKRSEELLTQLFENSPLGIVLLNEQHKVIQMNQGFKDIFGYSNEEIIGNQLNNILVPKDYRQEAIDINLLAARGKVSMLESRRQHKNGQSIPVIIYGVPVKSDNKTIGIYGIYVDITDRTRAENELQIRNNELDNFVYKVSHDLRAPLSSILGLVNLAHHKENNDDLLLYMGLIENRVKQLDSFINDVLSHSKNLKLATTLDEIDLNQVVEKCFTDLSYLPNAEKVKKAVRITNEPFYSDKWRINEIFRNLISNTIKYLNPHIDDPYVSIDIVVTEKAAIIKFNDNGIGIEEGTLPKVFEMFYRATEYSEGSGIGLYIVKNAIQKLGGEIRIDSKIGVGTSFNITIPNRKGEAHGAKGMVHGV